MNNQGYETILASYACRSELSRGRRYPEPESSTRNMFQRDRDRIIHSAAFRRLEYKTQVFVNHEGDHYRTRLTHSIEVAQIARSICRAMRLHEDLAEGVALAHDLGHTPFGHSGQDALNAVMKPHGGFEHNRQSLRVIEKLERRYAEFPGLNLSFETREGIVKHTSPHDLPRNADLADYHLDEQATLEAQIGNLADEIAYNNHDVDDGFRAEILNVAGLCTVPLFYMHYEKVMHDRKRIVERLAIHETIRRMINFLIMDVIKETARNIEKLSIRSLDDVRNAGEPLVGFSHEVRHMNAEMKRYLFKHMYHHYRVVRMATKATRVIQELFSAYMENPAMLPPGSMARPTGNNSEEQRARTVADYIAGMTDRYALDEHSRLFDVHART
ncbi:MAG: deoxyguanosinetriphosphate triphosphohydrolase [Zetaproteobacteria bacterium]|nr:MAG: deoxyguanosinetriphosphate triphosphohydrolase [Zetaproteobacteria bacterium]